MLYKNKLIQGNSQKEGRTMFQNKTVVITKSVYPSTFLQCPKNTFILIKKLIFVVNSFQYQYKM